ncbi:MAG: hypothetical protein J6Z38_05810 [Lachnospiraceae bacterium]|nr:hypothetical protein [Lachnospiraceae bacterium]
MNETPWENADAENALSKDRSERARTLGKWLWVLFWLFVPAAIAGFMKNDSLKPDAPGVYITGIILNAVCSAAYGFILFKLAGEDDEYRIAGIFELIGVAASIVMLFLPPADEDATLTLVVTVPAAVISILGEYHEYNAHANILISASHDLSDKWRTLWKWLLGMQLAVIGSVLVTLILPPLGIATLFVTAIGTLAVYVMKLIYLYRTAKIFRNYPGDGILA